MPYPYSNLEKFTLPSLLDRTLKLYKDQPFSAIAGQKSMSYDEFMTKIQLTIKLLQDNGISKGDKVLLLSENMPNWGVAYFAVTYFGAVIVPVLVEFPQSDVENIISHSEAKAVFVSDKYLSTIKESKKENIEFVINLENLQIVDELTNKNYISRNNEISKPDEDDMAAIIYTSGTTGHSNAVMLSHKNLVTNALSVYSKIKVTQSDIFLSILPLTHTFECTVGLIVPILNGCKIYYIDKTPTPSSIIKALRIVKPTIILSVPLVIEKIYKNKVLAKFNNSFILKNLYKIKFTRKILNKIAGKELIKSFGSNLRLFAIGGAPLPAFVEEFLIEAKFPYIVGYGLTETAPLIAASDVNEKPRLGSTGTVFSGVEISIKDKNPITGEGEIRVKSPSVMIGYYKDKEKTNSVMEDGWLLTGDLGYLDDDDFLYISGRIKNVILGSNGENIYPEQIEAVINKNEVVSDSLVLKKDGLLTAIVHLDYEMIDKMLKVNQDIADFLEKMRIDVNSQLSSFAKVAKFIEQNEPFIKTPTKKIKRYLYTE